MTVAVPREYVADVQQAAKVSGLPVAVVAAQINEESGFQYWVVSPAGAEGIAQFMPGTWASWGKGSPFNPADAFPAYARFMRYLLHLFGGSVRDALAGYNAGPGNIQAGMGYADTILSAAGEGYAVTAGGNYRGKIPPIVSRTDQAQITDQITGIARATRQLVGMRMLIGNVNRIPGKP